MTGAARPPMLRHDAVGAFESRLRAKARWRWLAPALLACLVLLGVGGWYLLTDHDDPEAGRLRSQALALLALDDAASLEAGTKQLEAALQREPGTPALEADRALALVLRAEAAAEEGAVLSARADDRLAERERLASLHGAEEAVLAAAAEAEALGAQAQARLERSSSLRRAALEVLGRVEDVGGGGPEVARALALHHAFSGERELSERHLAAGRAAAPEDRWLALAGATLEAAARDRAIATLSAVVTRHPDLLRARYLLARAQAELGREREAVVTLDRLLAANLRHERANALRAELTRPTPAAEVPAPVLEPQSDAGGAVKPAPLQRKPVTHPAPAAPTPVVAPPRAPRTARQPAVRDVPSEASPSDAGRTASAAAPAEPAPAPAAGLLAPAAAPEPGTAEPVAAPAEPAKPPAPAPAAAPERRRGAAPSQSFAPVEHGGG